MNGPEADRTGTELIDLLHIALTERELTGETVIAGIAVFTSPNFGEPFSSHTVLVEGPKASVTAIQFSLTTTFEAVVVV